MNLVLAASPWCLAEQPVVSGTLLPQSLCLLMPKARLTIGKSLLGTQWPLSAAPRWQWSCGGQQQSSWPQVGAATGKCTGKLGGCHSLQLPQPLAFLFLPTPRLEGQARFPSLPRVELPKAPCHARSQRTGSRNPALEDHDAEDEEPQHNVSRTRKGGFTLSPPNTLLSPEGTVGWSSG